MITWLEWLESWLPTTLDRVARGQAAIVLIACAALTLVIIALLIMWKISRDLEGVTVLAAIVMIALLWGLWWLAYSGYVIWAILGLVGLLLAILSADVFVYRSEPLAASGYMVPIVIAATGLGMGWGIAIAVLSTGIVWLFATGERLGWYRGQRERRRSYLTYNAPTLTVLYLLVAAISGVWFEYLQFFSR